MRVRPESSASYNASSARSSAARRTPGCLRDTRWHVRWTCRPTSRPTSACSTIALRRRRRPGRDARLARSEHCGKLAALDHVDHSRAAPRRRPGRAGRQRDNIPAPRDARQYGRSSATTTSMPTGHMPCVRMSASARSLSAAALRGVTAIAWHCRVALRVARVALAVGHHVTAYEDQTGEIVCDQSLVVRYDARGREPR